MVKVKTRRRTTHTVYVGENEDVELELDHAPEEDSVIAKRTPEGGWVVGYLSRDEDCENPLDDCEGCGKILDGRRLSATRDDYWAVRHDPDPLMHFLDVYSHSGDVWRVSGSGRYFPDEQWDVSRGAGLWVPDKEARVHILMTAAEEYANPQLFAAWREEIEAWKKAPRRSRGQYPSRGASSLSIDSACQIGRAHV